MFRPELAFSDGRTERAGVAFLLDIGEGRIVIATSGHLARNLRKGAQLVSFRLINNYDGHARGEAASLAGIPGATMNGLDFSTDVGLLYARDAGLLGEPYTLAPSAPAVGDQVEVIACPADASASSILIGGRVEGSDAQLLRVRLLSAVDGRGFAGAPLVRPSTREVVGIVQAVSGGVVLATPGAAVGRFAAGARDPNPLKAWT